jgi:glycosyltransferase involved in cell wall biosynthesis
MDPEAGGVSQAIINIIAGLTELGVENEVLSLDTLTEVPTGFTLHALGPGTGPWSYSNKLKPWLLEHLPDFDIVIIHGLWLYHGYAVNTIMKQLKKGKQIRSGSFSSNHQRLFIMPHGMLDPYFQRAKGRKLKAFRNLLYWKLIERHIINGADGILFTCKEESILARQSFRPYKPKRELIVGLGVKQPPDFSEIMQTEFLKKCPQLTEKVPYILFLSRIHPKKGIDILIKAYENLSRKIPDSASIPRLVIAGPGLDSAYGQEIQYKVSASKIIKDSVFFTGMLEGSAKWGAFYNSSFFILPSHQENFGIAVIEAMACSKPVIITNQINIWREIEEGGGGLVSEDSQIGIEFQMEKLFSLKEDEIKILGSKARNLFTYEYSIIPAAKKLLSEILS